jgi:hypothetical protein
MVKIPACTNATSNSRKLSANAKADANTPINKLSNMKVKLNKLKIIM